MVWKMLIHVCSNLQWTTECNSTGISYCMCHESRVWEQIKTKYCHQTYLVIWSLLVRMTFMMMKYQNGKKLMFIQNIRNLTQCYRNVPRTRLDHVLQRHQCISSRFPFVFQPFSAARIYHDTCSQWPYICGLTAHVKRRNCIPCQSPKLWRCVCSMCCCRSSPI